MYLRIQILQVGSYVFFHKIVCNNGRPQNSVNLLNWTGGSTRHGVRVAIEDKFLIEALGGPQEYLGAPEDPPEAQNGEKSP